MKVTYIKSLVPYLSFSIPIGIGTSAVCFLMRDGNIIKIYRESFLKKELFYNYDMKEHLTSINLLNNDSYIGPHELLIKDDKVVAYIYPFVKAKVIKKIDNNLQSENILKGYDKIYKDTKTISNQGFLLNDLHYKNILFNGNYYIIDLDKGKFLEQEYTDIFRKNITNINKIIINSIFGLKKIESLEFYDSELEKLYYNSLSGIEEYFYELIERLFYKNSNIKEVKKNNKIKVISKNLYYYNRF